MNTAPRRKPAFDVTQRYVRFRELREDGFVQFDFAIGDPELAVELMLSLADYKSFCRSSAAIHLTREQADDLDFESCKWRFGSPGLQK